MPYVPVVTNEEQGALMGAHHNSLYGKETRMNRVRYCTLRAGAVAAIVALIGFYVAGVSYAQHDHMMHSSTPQPAKETKPITPPVKEPVSLQVIYAQQLPAIQEAVGRATQHLEAGHQQEALNELKQVKISLAALQQALSQHVELRFVNDRCPIMLIKINRDKVPAELTRAYGQGKVGFCCNGCPTQWDRLTEAQKTAKLKEAASQPQ